MDYDPDEDGAPDRVTVCISTQVGCAMACRFCATGLQGFTRNLTTGEILEQIARLARLLPTDERLSHVVVMGMGEPLANLDRLLPALAVARDGDQPGATRAKAFIAAVWPALVARRLRSRDRDSWVGVGDRRFPRAAI